MQRFIYGKSILPIDPSFSPVLSLSRSYTIRSEVKQAALQRVCSSLTPCLQTISGQFEERGERKAGRKSKVLYTGPQTLKIDCIASFLLVQSQSSEMTSVRLEVSRQNEALAAVLK